jgi:general secretion pathway protein I
MKARGFSLLEVLVAVALLALGLTGLFLAQARSLELARQTRELSVATGLARMKLLECQDDLLKKGFSIGDYDEEGNFDDDGYAEFFWECHAYKPDIPTGDASDIQEGLSSGGAAAGGAGALGGALGGGGGGANPMAEMGAGMIAPVLSQISDVMGESIREMVVIVRWREGEEWTDIRVTTHLIDLKGMQAVAGQIRTATEGLGNLTGALGGGNAPTGGSAPSTGSPTPPPSIPAAAGGTNPFRGPGR